MLTTKKDYILRKFGHEYMLVPVGAASKDFSGIIRMNETGAFFWKELAAGATEESLVKAAMAHYDGLDEKTAQKDAHKFLETVAIALETC